MREMNLKIERYEGPLDLLLALISRHQIDIFDIPIAEIAEQYNEYLDSMREMDMELAGEFLVMAAELMLIKSRMLLPRQEGAEDPRKPLVDALLEHQRAVLAAKLLRERAEVFYDRFPKLPDEPEETVYRREHAVGLLTEAFARIAQRAEMERSRKEENRLFRELREERYYTVDEKMALLSETLRVNGRVRFESLFDGACSRGEIVAIFLSVLEAIRLGLAEVSKDRGGALYVLSSEEAPATDGDALRDPDHRDI